MYSLKSKTIATGVIAFTLFAAAPVFADSNNSGHGNNGLHLGVFARFLQEERKAEREQRQEDRKEARKHHATSTSATTTKQFTIAGTVTFISGTTLTVQGSKGAVYTVNASNASVIGHENRVLTFAALAVNDKVEVKGSLSNNVIIATKIKDKTDRTGKVFQSLKLGTVTAINGSAVTIANFGSSGSTVINTNTATKYKVNNTNATSSSLVVGSQVWVYGTSTATSTQSVNASLIVILTDGLNWFKSFWK